MDAVQPRLPPQAGVDRVGGRLIVQKPIAPHAPNRVPVGVQHLGMFGSANEAVLRIQQVLPVFNRQVVGNETVEVEGGLVGGHGSVSCYVMAV